MQVILSLTKRSYLLALIVVFLLAVPGTPAISQDQSIPQGISREELFGTMLRDSKWQQTSISVCWENPTGATAQYRHITRNAIEETWQRYSPLSFSGWGPCAADSKGIRIRISDEGRHTNALGKYLDGRPDGMVLNFTFKSWSPSCETQVGFCVYAIA